MSVATQENWHKDLRRVISLLESDRIPSLTQVFSSNTLRRELCRPKQVGVGSRSVSICAPWSFCPTMEHINVPSRSVRSISVCFMVAKNDHEAHWLCCLRTPRPYATVDEWQQLIDNCIWSWESQDGHQGYRVTGNTNGQSCLF